MWRESNPGAVRLQRASQLMRQSGVGGPMCRHGLGHQQMWRSSDLLLLLPLLLLLLPLPLVLLLLLLLLLPLPLLLLRSAAGGFGFAVQRNLSLQPRIMPESISKSEPPRPPRGRLWSRVASVRGLPGGGDT